MADIMDLLKGHLNDGVISQLSQQIGAGKEQTAAATDGIVSTLLGALSQKASAPSGAGGLLGMLDKNNDGSILDDVAGFVTGGGGSNAAGGLGILSSLLGNKAGGALGMISQMSGLTGEQTGSLLSKIAPIVMGVLGQTKNQQGLDASGLASVLTNSVSNNANSNPMMGMVTRFLDKDGDGDVMDDVVGMLGGLFKR